MNSGQSVTQEYCEHGSPCRIGSVVAGVGGSMDSSQALGYDSNLAASSSSLVTNPARHMFDSRSHPQKVHDVGTLVDIKVGC